MKLFLTSLIALFITLSTAAYAGNSDQILEITEAWARPTANSNTPGGVFLTISNHGENSVKLSGVASDVAMMAHLHMTANEDGMMTMNMLDEVIVPAGESFKFAPGAHHIMLMGLSKKLTKGDVFDLTLTFETLGDIVVSVTVTGMTGPISKDVP